LNDFLLFVYFQSIKAMKEENAKLLKETTALVGHSNHKQKIKFHEIVKNENLNLKKVRFFHRLLLWIFTEQF
jgi:hypothetical protein